MQQFGGNWTEEKLNHIQSYLETYTTALKNKGFTTVYIDAFAGTGYWKARSRKSEISIQGFSEVESEKFRKGSATRALEISLPFDQYIFVESDSAKFKELKNLKDQYPHLADRISLHNEEASNIIKQLCAIDWIRKNWRGVVFLDPYGMDVDWECIEAIAETKTLDLWLLFPLGIGVNRLITTTGNISTSWRNKLDRFFGTKGWYNEFYKQEDTGQLSLFKNRQRESLQKVVGLNEIAQYYNQRLKTVFAGVLAEQPMLTNRKNNPIYSLCFAVSNPNMKAKNLALKLARGVIERKC